MHYRQTVRNARHPGGDSRQAIGKVVALIEKPVRHIHPASALGAGEIAVPHRFGGKFIKGFGELRLLKHQRGMIAGGAHRLRCLPKKRQEHVLIGTKTGLSLNFCPQPMLFDLLQTDALKLFRCLQPFFFVEPECNPVLQIGRRTIFTLWTEPGHVDIHFVGGIKRRAIRAAKTDHHTRPGKFPHCHLRDRCTHSQHHRRRVGDGDIPVIRRFAFLGDIFHPAAINLYTAFLEIINIGPFRMQNRFKIGRHDKISRH
ncbi:hypothetical protein D3C80_1035090 [compost metagenome]